MTAEEAIATITGAQVIVPNRDPDKFVAAIDRALISLRLERQKYTPKPLTIKELQQMHGQPVWMEEEKVWGIINVDEYGQWKGIPHITFYFKSVRCDWNIVKRKLTCYRHKPKE